MSEIRVTFGEIEAAQQNVVANSGRVEAQLADLKAFLAPLVADWTGTAATNYQGRQREVDTAWADLNGVLRQIGMHLGTVNDNYRATEATNANRWA